MKVQNRAGEKTNFENEAWHLKGYKKINKLNFEITQNQSNSFCN